MHSLFNGLPNRRRFRYRQFRVERENCTSCRLFAKVRHGCRYFKGNRYESRAGSIVWEMRAIDAKRSHRRRSRIELIENATFREAIAPETSETEPFVVVSSTIKIGTRKRAHRDDTIIPRGSRSSSGRIEARWGTRMHACNHARQLSLSLSLSLSPCLSLPLSLSLTLLLSPSLLRLTCSPYSACSQPKTRESQDYHRTRSITIKKWKNASLPLSLSLSL